MGWIWLIPTFHIPHPAIPGKSHTVTFVRKEVDFPIGVGAGLIDVSVEMEWC
jgi:phosphatidylinositol-3,4,5-trisphosphate 3-phosphatase/dual-specificity protein phosphatase PTEN